MVTIAKTKAPRKKTIGQPIVAPNEYWHASMVLSCYHVSAGIWHSKLGALL